MIVAFPCDVRDAWFRLYDRHANIVPWAIRANLIAT
jgi:hypothetical protein